MNLSFLKHKPTKIVCIGLNYHCHAKELNMNTPRHPIMFMKPITTLIGPNDNIIYFSYAGATSMSAIIASKLYFENSKKLIIVAYKRPEKLNLSIRGKESLNVTKKILEKIEGATGGGHTEATGAMIPTTQIEEFEKLIKEL